MIRLVETYNGAIGAVAAGANMPLGAVVLSVDCGRVCNSAININTTGANNIQLNRPGVYRITYVGSVVVGAAGLVVFELVANGVVVETISNTATAIGDTEVIVLDKTIRVGENGANVQIRNAATSVALTGGTSNLTVEQLR